MNTEGFNTNQAIIQNGGCTYDSVGVEECGVYPDGEKACLYEYTQTDNEAQGSESQPDQYTEGQSPQGNSNDDTGQTSYTEDPPITNPDGSETQTTNETTTNTTGSGTTMWNDEDYIYVRDSTGTTTIYDRQNTTTTNTDGTVEETVVTTKSTQTPTTTTTTVNKNTGNSTTTQNSQSSTSSTTTTTNNYYDAEGNLTGSNSTTTGGNETENEGDEEKEGNCGAPGQPSCEVTLNGEDQLEDPAIAIEQSGVKQALDTYTESFGEIGEGDVSEWTIENPFNLPTTGVCNPAPYSYQYHGKTLNPMTKFCEAYDSTIHPALRYFFYALTAITLYFTFIYATMRT
ncbi:hypothetical protein [uncultured Methylophaga sp.]|uniref:hypothetical protein n=1 Tax=uncultured Methylophaga sp. TaxID=285271 RepID=UPI00260864E9|nr:hypothetical protein [uncultured Methylophaga sp.]